MTNSKRPGPLAPSQRPPSNLRDALTEARAVAGGGLSRTSVPPPASSAPMIVGRKLVLVVDDDPHTRARLRAGLEPYVDVVEARDGMEAAEIAPQRHASLAMVVTEVGIPRVDGFTLAKSFRAHPNLKRVPIMFVSSRNGPQEVTQALVLGACQYLPKSTPTEEIVAKIRKIVQV